MNVALAMMPQSSEREGIEEDLKEIEQKIKELLETARALNIKGSLNYMDVDLPDLIRKTAMRFNAGKPCRSTTRDVLTWITFTIT